MKSLHPIQAEIVPVFDKMAGIHRWLSDTLAFIIDGKVWEREYKGCA